MRDDSSAPPTALITDLRILPDHGVETPTFSSEVSRSKIFLRKNTNFVFRHNCNPSLNKKISIHPLNFAVALCDYTSLEAKRGRGAINL